MDIKERLDIEMKKAAKARDKLRLSTIRLMRNAITTAEIDTGKTLAEPEMIEILGRLGRKYQDSIEAFQKGNRPELVEKEKAELNILNEFLPEPLAPGEISEMVRKAIGRVGAKSQKDMGRVMQELKPEFAGRASGRDVSEEVKKQLTLISK
jgi:uncharacterized protein YqeY